METYIKTFKNEREKMKESLLDIKCRSMKYNLVFTGLRETLYENTEEKLQDFLGQELEFEHWIEFGNVFDRENQRMKTCRKRVIRFSDRLSLASSITGIWHMS